MHSLQINMCNKCYCKIFYRPTVYVQVFATFPKPLPFTKPRIFSQPTKTPKNPGERNLPFPPLTLRQRQQLAEKDKQLQKASTSHLEGALVRRIHYMNPITANLWDMEKDGDMMGMDSKCER